MPKPFTLSTLRTDARKVKAEISTVLGRGLADGPSAQLTRLQALRYSLLTLLRTLDTRIMRLRAHEADHANRHPESE